MTGQIEARAAKVEAALEAKGIQWSMDIADIVRDEISSQMMTGSAPTAKVVSQVMKRIKPAAAKA